MLYSDRGLLSRDGVIWKSCLHVVDKTEDKKEKADVTLLMECLPGTHEAWLQSAAIRKLSVVADSYNPSTGKQVQ